MKLEDIDVKRVLEEYKNYDWIIQGAGLLRTYLDGEGAFRLHLWSPDIKIPGLEYIHTHRWDFVSRVIAGKLTNVHYADHPHPDGEFVKEAITPDGVVIGFPERCRLERYARRTHNAGDQYYEQAEVVHTVRLTEKCITVIHRRNFHNKPVYSFRHINEGWANAKARPASKIDLEHYIPQFKEMI